MITRFLYIVYIILYRIENEKTIRKAGHEKNLISKKGLHLSGCYGILVSD